MKKAWTVLLVVLIMVIGMTSAVSAASVTDIITALEAGHVPDVYIAQAESYFASHTVTSAQADQLITFIKAATTTAAGETKLSELSASQRTAIVADITKAAQVIGLTATYDNKAITVKDNSNQVVFTVTSASAVKQTGYDYTIIFAGLGFLVLAGAATLVSRKALSRCSLQNRR